ncbi:hypothetical protein VR5_262 [Escherichia phage vb_EcoM-VR5]|uniref:Uncharacterized protein n=1 Tax=Escherichia phage vb_EcoM-VR5 TaxID=1567026 RepID=A0A0A7HFM8_9CAUD|nr:hypothetical protein AVV69_gp146 [Escherichia phage vb_EcoM-VR5]AIZ02049.1 hypothetical protein VR5_262 [Escherichia phage vb_EcoM-VR5]
MQPIYTFIWLVIVIVWVSLFAAGVWVPGPFAVGFICTWFVIDAIVKFLEALVKK